MIKQPTLTKIKKDIIKNGGTYRKLKMTLNGNPAYEVSGRTMTKDQMIEEYMLGLLV